jgi:hypothetical protein
VQRTTVNAVARELQDEGLITTRRGIIEVHDRAGLERRSCECYDRVEHFFGDIVGPEGARAGLAGQPPAEAFSPAWNGTSPSIVAGHRARPRSSVIVPSLSGKP